MDEDDLKSYERKFLGPARVGSLKDRLLSCEWRCSSCGLTVDDIAGVLRGPVVVIRACEREFARFPPELRAAYSRPVLTRGCREAEPHNAALRAPHPDR